MSILQIIFPLLGLFVTVLIAVLGWMVAGLRSSLGGLSKNIEALRKEIADHRVEVARDYATRESVRDDLTALETRVVTRVDRMEASMGKQFDALFGMLRNGAGGNHDRTDKQ